MRFNDFSNIIIAMCASSSVWIYLIVILHTNTQAQFDAMLINQSTHDPRPLNIHTYSIVSVTKHRCSLNRKEAHLMECNTNLKLRLELQVTRDSWLKRSYGIYMGTRRTMFYCPTLIQSWYFPKAF